MRIITKENIEELKFDLWKKLPLNVEAVQIDEDFEVVSTKDELMYGKAGDYMVRGTAGCLYPVDKKIFEDTYRKVQE